MVFRRGRSSKGMIIDSVKHEIRFSTLLATGGSIKNVVLATGVNVPSTDQQVKTGSLIKALFFEINFNFESNITAVVDWVLVKIRTGQAASGFDPAIPNQANRSQIFLWGMEMPAGINNSSAIKRIGTLLIPKGKQRMSEGDSWNLLYRTTAGTNQEDACGHFIYKEYR